MGGGGRGRDKNGRLTSPDDDHSGSKTTITRIRAVVPHDVNIRRKRGQSGRVWRRKVEGTCCSGGGS